MADPGREARHGAIEMVAAGAIAGGIHGGQALFSSPAATTVNGRWHQGRADLLEARRLLPERCGAAMLLEVRGKKALGTGFATHQADHLGHRPAVASHSPGQGSSGPGRFWRQTNPRLGNVLLVPGW